eukprot:GHVT01090419.1.p1 GENE.GHVT01090419.1~~GHVT01090419.1.p1  ORF type:complete len:270 (+),score=27.08 GHVT01090419.1:611-1420(+)
MASNEITGCQGFPTLQYTESFRTCEQFKEGQGYTKRAERALSTSFFSLKFSPDWDVAAAEYGRAAQCFQTGAQRICPVDPGALQHAAATHLKVAAIRERQHDSFGAGRAREQAGRLLVDAAKSLEPSKDSAALLSAGLEQWRTASLRYEEGGKAETSVRLLRKVAAEEETSGHDVTAASATLSRAIAIHTAEEQFIYASDVYREQINLLARNSRWDDLVPVIHGHLECLQRQQQHSAIHRALLSLILVHRARGDLQGAEDVVAANDVSH